MTQLACDAPLAGWRGLPARESDPIEAAIKVAHIATIDESLQYLLLNQLLSLRRAGYQVVGISSPGVAVPVIEAAGIPHIPVPMSRRVTPVADLLSLKKLYSIIRREGFTIVHTHTPKAALLGQLAARMAGVPIVVNTLHGLCFHEQMRPAVRRLHVTTERIAARCSSTILSQGKEDIETAVREGICSPEKIRYLGNGIDLTRFAPERFCESEVREHKHALGLPADAPVVGFVGRLAGRRKGFTSFLAAGQQVHETAPQARFLIVGAADHGKPDAVEPSVAAQYGIAKYCLFLGQRPNEELPLLYRVMDVLVLPSLYEGVPRVVMEATAMRVPVVATNVKGNREVVEHGRNGLLVSLGDVRSLAKAILAVITHQEMARRMGTEGYGIAQQRFDERLVFDRVKAEYARLLQTLGLLVPVATPEVSAP